jgi:hypothetical protein
MASYGDVLEALRDYRNVLEVQTQSDIEAQFAEAGDGVMNAFAATGGSPFTTPLSNVHATGVGIRVKGGKPQPGDFVLKVYVYDKIDLGTATPALTKNDFQGVEIDVEPLPIQLALATAQRAKARSSKKASAGSASSGVQPQRKRVRPIVGGVSIAPINEHFVGTLGCFLRRVSGGTEQIFALSNNHVLADTNRLPIGTQVVQPGPEVAPTNPGDVFAALSSFVPIQFPATRLNPVVNRLDCAIAIVTDKRAIKTGRIFGITRFTPTVLTPVPGMRVIKSGRTSGVTTGIVTATRVNGVQINYGTRTAPRIATFNDTISIVGDGGVPFSAPGDSGSIIIDRDTNRPVALLFAGDGRTTTACDLGGVCSAFQAFPV